MLDWKYIFTSISFLWDGFVLNLFLAIPAFIIGTILGLLFSSVQFIYTVSPKLHTVKNQFKPVSLLNNLSIIFVSTIRSISVLLIGLFLFFTLPIIGIDVSSEIIAIIALSVGTSALLSELIRPALTSTLPIIHEPALALGSSHCRSLILLGIPYILRNNIPIFTTVLITVIKDSVIFSALGLHDISKKASQLINIDFKVIEVWITVLLINLVFIQLIFVFSKWLERKFRHIQH